MLYAGDQSSLFFSFAFNQALFNKVRVDDTQAVTVIGTFGCRKEYDVRVLGVEVHPEIDHPILAQAVIGLTMDKGDLALAE